MKKKELPSIIAFIILGLAAVWLSSRLEPGYYSIGPGFAPTVLGVMLLMCNLLRLIAIFLKPKESLNSDTKIEESENGKESWVLVAAAASIVTVYIIGNYLVGFLIATILFLLGFMHFLKNKSWKIKIFIPLVVSIGISAIFRWVLVLPLPEGIIW